jgi:hypothetical protein
MPEQRGLFDEQPPTPAALSDPQVRAAIRARHPGMLILVRLSPERYEWMDEDRETVARLGLGPDVPVSELQNVLRKVLRAGHRVAIAEPTSNPGGPA